MPRRKVAKKDDEPTSLTSRSSKRIKVKKQIIDENKKLIDKSKVGQRSQLGDEQTQNCNENSLTAKCPANSKKQGKDLIVVQTSHYRSNRSQGVNGKELNNIPYRSSSLKSDVENHEQTDFKLKYHAEVDRRRNVQKLLFVEKDRSRHLSLQLKEEKEENRKLHQRIGALEHELSKNQTLETYGPEMPTSIQSQHWHGFTSTNQFTNNTSQPWPQFQDYNNSYSSNYGYNYY